ncbi:MAG: hypothetical protein O7G86_06820, partial [Gammaproteobacteria bacterium]|nr:hypothetical protein [Gammaproteobacteria bacterium]
MAVRLRKRVERHLLALLGAFALVPLSAMAFLAIYGGSTPSIFNSVSQFSQLAIAATTLALIIVAAFILRILRRNLTPLADLQDAIHRLANGDYSRR